MEPCSYAWRGWRGCGKRTQLLDFIKVQADAIGVPFEIKKSVWFLNKQSNNADPDEDDDDGDSLVRWCLVTLCSTAEITARHAGT